MRLSNEFTVARLALTDGTPRLTDTEWWDERILEAMEGWHVNTYTPHAGVVRIPGTWESSIYPYKYFMVIKEPDDVNPGEDENEIQCYLSCGWEGYDDEVVIVLTLLGKSVLDESKPVVAEIYKFGAFDMEVWKDGKMITNFKRKRFFGLWTQRFDKVTYTLGEG